MKWLFNKIKDKRAIRIIALTTSVHKWETVTQQTLFWSLCMIWIVRRKGEDERIKMLEEQGSVLNHSDAASVCIYLTWEEAQWDFWVVYPVRFVVRTFLAPGIFITAIVSQSFSASASGDYNAWQANKRSFSNRWCRNMFAAAKHSRTKYSQCTEAGTLYLVPFWKFSNCVGKKVMSFQHRCVIVTSFSLFQN